MFVDASTQTDQDWHKVADYLRSQNLVLDLDKAIKQFSAGAANLNYLIHLNGSKAVMRCPPPGSAPGANDVEREYKVLSGLNKCYPYAPQAMHLCKDDSVIGVHFCISEFRKGVAIKEKLPPNLEQLADIGHTLGMKVMTALAELHNIGYVTLGLSDLGKGEGYLERQAQGWGKRAQRVLQGEQLAQCEKLVAWLMDNLPSQRPLSLVHNDFKLDNMLIDPETLTVNAVLDWDMCTIGDPVYDLILTLLYWGEPGETRAYSHMAKMPYTAPSWPSRQQALKQYNQVAEQQLAMQDFAFYWVLGVFRYAIVIAQLLSLYQKGFLTSGHITAENEQESVEIIELLLAEAWAAREYTELGSFT